MSAAAKASYIQIKVDPQLKADAISVAEGIGMNLSTLITVCLKRIVADQAIPFPLEVAHIPNATTREAIREAREGKGEHFENVEDALRSLGI